MVSTMPASRSAIVELVRVRGRLETLLLGAASHTWISVIRLSWISVKWTVAGFFPHTWQSIGNPSAGRDRPPEASESQHPVRERGQSIIVCHHDERLMPLTASDDTSS